MNKKLLRSIFSIPIGWIASFVGCIITLIIIAIFNPEDFRPGIQYTTGWLLAIMTISFFYGIVGGFVTAFIAQRNEIKHAIGLAVFSLLFAIYFSLTSKASVTHWYKITGIISVIPAVLLGGWLRMKQRVLIENKSQGMIKATANIRFLLAICLSILNFIVVVMLGTLFGGLALIKIQHILFGEDFISPVFFPMFLVSAFFSLILSRYIYRKIIGDNADLKSTTKQNLE